MNTNPDNSWLMREMKKFDDCQDMILDDGTSYFSKTADEIAAPFTRSKIRLSEVGLKPDFPNEAILGFAGGLNGRGNWTDYFKDILALFQELNKRFGHAWCIKLDNDCCDDVWYLIIGVEIRR